MTSRSSRIRRRRRRTRCSKATSRGSASSGCSTVWRWFVEAADALRSVPLLAADRPLRRPSLCACRRRVGDARERRCARSQPARGDCRERKLRRRSAGGESIAVAYARSRGVDATSGHDVSAAYGLRARTRTAALNAAILPKMVRTARMTAAAVERAAIPAPLMVMRSDGGVMDVREVERRPILDAALRAGRRRCGRALSTSV